MTFGNRVRDIRKQKDITQEKLAKMLGFSHASTISFIENGKRRLDAEKIPTLADALGVSIDELFFAQKVVETTTGEVEAKGNESITNY
ncbi:helix-turn-helix domain-containing protein [Bacillus toyonensis]|uniref:Helix-turn-helix domain-containing protein n=1 Tax=Bacillus toyonensis TaxID=155322 RepID=A0ABX6GC08_9BACI|nr:helix-turn-helix transcriptional regulator [Bacillus toyonensis]MBX0352995.1 helix-turn-helix domain-containing protein [Bacillus toyonensis]QHA19380.1 helix-turn-helix domain-containing protein [Bacillus toyonensis]